MPADALRRRPDVRSVERLLAAQAAQVNAARAAGLRDFRDVLDAQRSLHTLQDSLALSGAAVSSDLVQLFRALGGGWSATEMLPEKVAPGS